MNGREFTADDVVFNFHRLLGLGEFAEAGPSPFTYQRPAAESVTATDRYTVVIKLPEPSSAALGQYLGHRQHHLYESPPKSSRSTVT